MVSTTDIVPSRYSQAKTADQENPALQQAHYPSRDLGRAVIISGDRVPGKSAEGKVRHPFYKGLRED
jgi:hypothetical protein